MASFRKETLGQIEKIDAGRIFTFRDFSFDTEKTANVAVLFSEQSRKGVLVRIEKGAYYHPKKSVRGLGNCPSIRMNSSATLLENWMAISRGAYIYNKMELTEQVATTITIATPNLVRRFRFKNLDVECVKAYCMDCSDESLVPYLRLLDAIKDMKRIPGTTGQDIYNRVKSQYFNGYNLPELKKIVSLAKSYPPRVRKTVTDILGDIGQTVLQAEMAKTLLPTTRFNLDYRVYKNLNIVRAEFFHRITTLL